MPMLFLSLFGSLFAATLAISNDPNAYVIGHAQRQALQRLRQQQETGAAALQDVRLCLLHGRCGD